MRSRERADIIIAPTNGRNFSEFSGRRATFPNFQEKHVLLVKNVLAKITWNGS